MALAVFGTQDVIGNGSGTVSPAASAAYTDPIPIPDTYEWVDFRFNARGLADLNAAHGGTLSFFGELSVPDLSTGVQEWYAFDGVVPASGHGGLDGDPIALLVVTPAPEPTTMVLLGPAMLGWWGMRRRMRRRV